MKIQTIKTLIWAFFFLSLMSCGVKDRQNREQIIHYFIFQEKASNCQSILEQDLGKMLSNRVSTLLEEKNLELDSGMLGKTYEYQNGMIIGKFSNLNDCNEFQKLYSKR